MFYARKNNENSKPVPAEGSLYTYICEDGYSYAPFPEKICEGYEEIPEELFLEKTKDLYQEGTEWGVSGFPILQISNKDRYGVVMLSDKLGDNSKVKAPTADLLKLVLDIANEALEFGKNNAEAIKNGNPVTIIPKDGSITTPKLADEAVTEIKIKDNSISEPKLQDNCVTTNKIKDGSISTNKIKDNSISEPKLQDDCVTNKKIKNGTITKDKISKDIINSINDSILEASKIPDNSIESSKIKDGTITGSKIKDNNISESKLQNNCVTENKIKDGSITNPKLANLSISENKLQDNSISTSKIKDGSITNSKFANLSISENKLQNSSVSTSKLQNSCVTKAKLGQDVLNAISSSGGSNISSNSISASQIKDIAELSYNVFIGNGAGELPDPYREEAAVAIGKSAASVVRGSTSIGASANCPKHSSIAIGKGALANWYWTTSVGVGAKSDHTSSSAFGANSSANHLFSTAVGAEAKTIGEYQIMLGKSGTTPYAYKSLSIISDTRDKTDIRDIEYNSLEFLNKLKPKQYKMDCRMDYKRDEEISKEEYDNLSEYDKRVHTNKYKVYELTNGFKYIDYYKQTFKNLKKDSTRYDPILKTKDIFLNRETAETELKNKMIKDGVIKNESNFHLYTKEVGEIILKEVFLESDGSMAGKRYHNGFLAQEVEDTAKSMNFDFAGVKYLAHNGNGEDMYAIAYAEFIPLIISAIQMLSRENEELKNRIEVLEKSQQID